MEEEIDLPEEAHEITLQVLESKQSVALEAMLWVRLAVKPLQGKRF